MSSVLATEVIASLDIDWVGSVLATEVIASLDIDWVGSVLATEVIASLDIDCELVVVAVFFCGVDEDKDVSMQLRM